MFARKIAVRRSGAGKAGPELCPQAWIDSFAMRNFTNDAVFDDTLPTGEGRMEIGARVPLDRLRTAMEDWFRRKGWLRPGEGLELEEQL